MAMPSPALDSQQPDEVPGSRRSTELWMMLFACGVVLFAFVNVAGSLKDQHLSTIFEYVIAFLVIVLGAHLAIRRWAPYADPLLLPIATVLNGLGLVMIYRLNQAGRDGNLSANGSPIGTLSSHATVTQILYSVIGVIALVLFLAFIKDIKALQPYPYILGLAGIFLIAIPAMLPASISGVAGTSAKIQVSIGGFSVQPEEFGKLLLAASFASYLVVNGKKLSLLTEKWWIFSLPRRRDLAPILVVWAVSMLLLIFESDIGTSAVFMGLFVAMLYIATGRRSWAILGFAMFVAGAFIAGLIFAHIRLRFGVWLHPFSAANLLNGNQPSYQPVQGLYGMANGGLLGRGLGGGQPFWTPLVQSDEIFTAFGEELGVTGTMAMLLLYGLFVQRGLRTAILAKDEYSKLLASGLAFMFALQVFVIVGGVTNLIPFAGIPTPFLSQGGSSLVASWLIVAALARMSDTARRPAPKPIQDEGMTQVVSLR
ncbi:MAG TPA: FtsW/RodA/SpoVE family cell cycle protein [Trebonia sp.]|nr:FtsW/RodA/SpoVE family cell cycle protein [Trebonia sp.]